VITTLGGKRVSDVIDKAVAALSERMNGEISGTAKFVLNGEGSIMIDSAGVRAGDEEADVTLTADSEVFQNILEGETNPTAAFMTGQLTVDGDMGLAMQLATVLS
jgi:putative sterol carrier protein